MFPLIPGASRREIPRARPRTDRELGLNGGWKRAHRAGIGGPDQHRPPSSIDVVKNRGDPCRVAAARARSIELRAGVVGIIDSARHAQAAKRISRRRLNPVRSDGARPSGGGTFARRRAVAGQHPGSERCDGHQCDRRGNERARERDAPGTQHPSRNGTTSRTGHNNDRDRGRGILARIRSLWCRGLGHQQQYPAAGDSPVARALLLRWPLRGYAGEERRAAAAS